MPLKFFLILVLFALLPNEVYAQTFTLPQDTYKTGERVIASIDGLPNQHSIFITIASTGIPEGQWANAKRTFVNQGLTKADASLGTRNLADGEYEIRLYSGPGPGLVPFKMGNLLGTKKIWVGKKALCDNSNPLGYRSAPCTRDCMKKVTSYSFFFTVYNVSGSVGIGEHQGTMIASNYYEFDDRYPASKGIKQPWTEGSKFSRIVSAPIPPDYRDNTLQDPVSSSALCRHDKGLRKFFFNHGRTVAMAPSKDAYKNQKTFNIPLHSLETFLIGPEKITAQKLYQQELKTYQCMNEIKDGYCDVNCMNCSYVLPETDTSSIYTKLFPSQITGQTTAFKRSEDGKIIDYRRTCFDNEKKKACTGKGAVPTLNQRLTVTNTAGSSSKQYNDPFTHCVNPANPNKGTQVITPKVTVLTGASLTGWGEQIISGAYGHNSNTDAEAAFIHYLSCRDIMTDPLIRDTSMRIEKSCRTCGKNRFNSANKFIGQSPCLDHTNEAQSDWFRTDNWSHRLHNIDDGGLGLHPAHTPSPIPGCGFDGTDDNSPADQLLNNLVHGM